MKEASIFLNITCFPSLAGILTKDACEHKERMLQSPLEVPRMEILKRAREIVLNPKGTWSVIKGENIEVKELFINYAAPLALIPAVASFIGMVLIGMRVPSGEVLRAPFFESLAGGVIGYVLQLAGVLAGAWVVKYLAPSFNSKADLATAAKLVVYAMTPVWLLGIIQIIPGLGVLSILGLYSIYLLATGLPALLDTPHDKVIWYTGAIVIAGIVISFILSIVVVGAIYGPMYMRMMAI